MRLVRLLRMLRRVLRIPHGPARSDLCGAWILATTQPVEGNGGLIVLDYKISAEELFIMVTPIPLLELPNLEIGQ
jgi:hypothetical protein